MISKMVTNISYQDFDNQNNWFLNISYQGFDYQNN